MTKQTTSKPETAGSTATKADKDAAAQTAARANKQAIIDAEKKAEAAKPKG